MSYSYACASFVLLLTVAVQCDATIIETFDSTGSITGFSTSAGSDSSSTITWDGVAGNPGGSLIYTEAADGGLDRLALSSDYLGNRLAYYNGTLSYDLYFIDGNGSLNLNRTDDVQLFGGGLTLTYDFATLESTNTWLSRTIVLNDTGAWTNSATNVAATNAEIQTALADLQNIYLMADYAGSSSPDTTRFDNISLVPEPSSVALLLGFFGLNFAFLSRRR